MPTERPFEPQDWREGRRLRAWDLHQQGWKQTAIAEALGVSRGAVSQWLKRGRENGAAGLRYHPPPGAKPRLSADQLAELRALLDQGAEAFGFLGAVWTSKRVAAVIKRWFGVTYHRAYVSRLVRMLGLSVQKPVVRATQRDEAVIQAWWDERWPELKKMLPHRDKRSSG
jgi:transposase